MRKLRSRKAETDGGKRFLRARRNPADLPVRALNESDLDSKVVEGPRGWQLSMRIWTGNGQFGMCNCWTGRTGRGTALKPADGYAGGKSASWRTLRTYRNRGVEP